VKERSYSLRCIQNNIGAFYVDLALGFLHRVDVNSVVDVSELHTASFFKAKSLISAITTSIRSFTYERYLKNPDPEVLPLQSVPHLLKLEYIHSHHHHHKVTSSTEEYANISLLLGLRACLVTRL
jgi:hypothetical protein